MDEAHHVVEADRLLHERLPDAIVLDIGLPGIDGLFFCGRLRENPRTARIPIIAISGSVLNGESAVAAGATAFVQKPFDPLELLTLLEQSIGVTPLAHAFGPGVSDEAATVNAAELRRFVEFGRRRHELLDRAYRQTLAQQIDSMANHIYLLPAVITREDLIRHCKLFEARDPDASCIKWLRLQGDGQISRAANVFNVWREAALRRFYACIGEQYPWLAERCGTNDPEEKRPRP